MKDKIKQYLASKGHEFTGTIRANDTYGNPDYLVNLITQCFNDLQPQWVSVDDLPSKTCHVWANHMHKIRIIEFYRCPEYGNYDWSYDCEDIHEIDFTHYMIINEPLPPSEGE
jgi:hypothetical protein